MRQTKKWVAAQWKANELSIRWLEMTQEDVYAALAKAGWVWNAEAGKWLNTPKGSTLPNSMFIDNEGKPSGIYRVRFWAHKDEMDAAVSEVITGARLQILEIGEIAMDENGISGRVYLTLKLSAASKVKLAKQLRQKNEVQRG